MIQVDGGSTATYVYDAFGQRVKKTVASYPTEYMYTLDGQIDSMMEGSAGHLTRGFVYLNGRPLVEYANGTTYFVHTDHLGSTRLLTNYPTPTIAESDDYYPFGEFNSSGSTSALKFTTDERDTETTLDHTLFRQYSSSLARWSSPDPAGFLAADASNPQSWNRYQYVKNNPLSRIDPSGLDDCLGGEHSNCVSDWFGPGGGGFGMDLWGGGRNFWDGSPFIDQCLCRDGVVGGHNIFDASSGAPGTYLTLDAHGRLGFGFSEDLYRSTLNYIDTINSLGIRGCASAPPPYDDTARACTTLALQYSSGYQVFVQQVGAFTLASGFIVDLESAQADALRYYHPTEYSLYSAAVNGFGAEEDSAYHLMIAPNPQAAADWLNYQAAFNEILQVLNRYLSGVQIQSAPYPAPRRVP
jgi:RHS repeat-associated protein